MLGGCLRVGIEVGGTFTDLVAVERKSIVLTKVPSTPSSPDIDPRYFSDAGGADLATLVEGIKIQRRIVQTSPMAALIDGGMEPHRFCQTDEEIANFVRGHCTTIYHPCGTCRMGTDDGAVVDPSSFAVKGVDGLYVADASVFPTVPSGNTNATVILVAERAARVQA